MPTYKTIVTDAGAAALSAAIAGAQDYRLTEMAVGDGDGAATSPTASDTELTNELYRGAITLLSTHPEHPNQLIAEFPAPANELAGETLREAGLFDETGTLFAICNLPETIYPGLEDGGARDVMIRMIFETTNADDVELLIDPNVVLATREWVSQNSSAAAALDGPVVVYPGQQAEYRITNYHAFYAYSLNVPAPHTGALLGDRVTLNIDPSVAAGTFQLGITASGFYRAQTITILDNIVMAPELTSPAPDEVVVGFPVLRCSAFSDYPSGVDTHINTHWQLASDATFSTLIIDEITDSQLTSFLANTTPATNYFARVRHQGGDAGWSAWSDVVAFATANAPWLDWDDTSPRFATTLDGGTGHVLRLNETDALVIADTTPAVATIVRVSDEGVDIVGESDLPAGMQTAELQNRGDHVLFCWADAGSLYVQLASVNSVLGTLTFLDTPVEVLDNLTAEETIGRVLALPDQNRFVITTTQPGLKKLGVASATTLRMRGLYISPSDNGIVLGETALLGSGLMRADACLVDNDLIVTVAMHEAGGSPAETSLTLATWRMPGIEFTAKDTQNYTAIPVTLFDNGIDERYPDLQITTVQDHAVIATQTDAGSGFGPLLVQAFFDGSELATVQGEAMRENYAFMQSHTAGFYSLCAVVNDAMLWIEWVSMARVFSTAAGLTAEQISVVDTPAYQDELRQFIDAMSTRGAWIDDHNYLHPCHPSTLTLLRVDE